MQRLVLTAPELAGLQYQPGQDMMLMVAVDGDRPVRRRYTIRALDPARRLLTLDVVRHAGGPGERWVAAARPGDRIEGIGPRGKIFLAPDGGLAPVHRGTTPRCPPSSRWRGRCPPARRALVILEVPGHAGRAGPGHRRRRRGDLAAPGRRPGRRPGGAGGGGRGGGAATGRAATPTWPARPRSCSGCGRRWPRAGWRRSRSHPRPTGGGGRANASHGEPARDG